MGNCKKNLSLSYFVRETISYFKQEDGIWRFLLPERESHYTRFIRDYETVRRFEGRFSPDASYDRALPFKDTSRKFSADWKIRAASFGALEKILTAELTVLDMDQGTAGCRTVCP